MFSNRLGFGGLLKDGARYFKGLDEATMRNIDACRKLAAITHTSLGPNSMSKIIVNHFDKQFVTSDAAVIVNELEVQHPAAKMLVLAAKMQEQEFGDGTNFVIALGGELLSNAESLLRQGLHSADIIKGFELGLDKAVQVMNSATCWTISNIRDPKELSTAITTALASKQLGSQALLGKLVAEASSRVMPTNAADFNTDNIRVVKLIGGSLAASHVIDGMVMPRDVSGSETSKSNCKVAVYGCGLESSATEAKGTVSLKSAEELLAFSQGDEDMLEEVIKAIADTGVEALVVGGSVSDIAQHFCNKYKLLVLRVLSKFELRRLCKTIGAVAIVRLGAPTAEEMGRVDFIGSKEISSKKVTLIQSADSKIASIVLRGATMNALDELERAIDDAVCCVRAATKDPRFVPGGGAAEMQVVHEVQKYGRTFPGMEQYGVVKFGESLECVARILSENSGYNSTMVITKMHAALQQGQRNFGVNVTGGTVAPLIDAKEALLVDHCDTKVWAMKLATEAAITVLRVDQIIMAKPAGGPKPPQGQGHWDDQDD